MKTRLIIGVCAVLLVCQPVVVEAIPRATTYRNCTELNKVYKGGVARVGAKNVGGKTKYTPFYSNELYKANSGSDRDKDGIACEK